MHTLITADQLVAESQPRHKTSFLKPEDGCEGTGEENTLDSREGNEALSEAGFGIGDPAQGPVSLPLDAWNSLNGIEEIVALSGVFYIRINKERIGFGVYVLPVMMSDICSTLEEFQTYIMIWNP